MSTIVVVKKGDRIAIGADTLTTYGGTRESADYIVNHSKIMKFGPNFIASVGHASFGLVLQSYFAQLRPRPMLDSAHAVFEMARPLHDALKEKYFLNPTEDTDDPFESSQHQCLIANPHGIFGLYALRSVQEYTRFYAFGSGYEFALGAMHAVYNSGLNSQAIARAGLDAAIDFDKGSGAPVEIHSIQIKPAK